MNVGNNIGNLNMLIFKQISNRHKELGFDITPVQAMIIMGVYNNESLCQKDIEQFVTCNKSTLSSVLDTMEKNGLIMRIEDKYDSRKKIISLTDKSNDIAKVLEKDCGYMDDLLTAGLSQHELEIFNSVIDKMINNLERN